MSITIETPVSQEDKEATQNPSRARQIAGIKIIAILALLISLVGLGGFAYLATTLLVGQNERETLETAYGDARDKIQRIEFELNSIQSSHTKFSTQIESLQNNVKQTQGELNGLQAGLVTELNQFNTLGAEITDQKKQIAALKSEVGTIQGYFRGE